MSENLNRINRILLNRLNLLEILRTTQCLLDKKSDNDLSMLEMIMDSENTLGIRISDGSIMLECSLKAEIQILSDVSRIIKVNPYDLYERIRRIDSLNVLLLSNEKTLTIEYGEMEKQDDFEHFDQGSFTLDQFKSESKSIKPEGVRSVFQIDHQVLINYLRFLKTAIAAEDIREQFRGASVIVESNKIILWSTDGLKMSFAEIEEMRNEQNISGIWPRKFIDALCSINQDGKAEIKMYPKQIQYTLNNLSIISPLINAKMLDYKNIMNFGDDEYTRIVIDSTYFSKKLERILVVTKNEGSALFNICEESTLVAIKNNRTEKAEVEVKFIHWNKVPAKVYLNPAIIANFARNFKGDIEIKIYSKNGNIVINKQDHPYPLFLTKLMNPERVRA